MIEKEEVRGWLTESVSYTALLENIRNVVRKFATEKGWSYPVEVFDDSVIYEVGEPSRETVYFKALYTRDDAGAITLGAPMKVKRVTSYPIASEGAGKTAGGVVEATGDPLTASQEEFREDGGTLLEVEDVH